MYFIDCFFSLCYFLVYSLEIRLVLMSISLRYIIPTVRSLLANSASYDRIAFCTVHSNNYRDSSSYHPVPLQLAARILNGERGRAAMNES